MKTLKITITFFVAIFSFGTWALVKTSSVSEKTATKIGYVDLETALAQELLPQNFLKNLEKKYQDLKQREDKARKDFETKMGEYRAKMNKLSEQARAKEEQELGSQINSLQQKLMQDKMKLDQEHQQWLQIVEKENRRLIEKIAKESGFSLVLNSAVLLFASDDIKKNDLTKSLIEEYNRANPLETKGSSKSKPVKKKRG